MKSKALLEAAADHGASEATFILLRLPLEVSALFRDWLLRERPDRYRHVMSLIRSMRGGKDYDAKWGERMRGRGPYAEQIAKRFSLAAKRLKLNLRRRKLNTGDFVQPQKGGVQLDLFLKVSLEDTHRDLQGPNMTFSPSLFDLPFADSPDLELERKHAASFANGFCGVDEAGRGPWAGPVVTAAVILDYDNVPAGLDVFQKTDGSQARRIV